MCLKGYRAPLREMEVNTQPSALFLTHTHHSHTLSLTHFAVSATPYSHITGKIIFLKFLCFWLNDSITVDENRVQYNIDYSQC